MTLKKILCLLLVFCMALSLTPTVAFAEETDVNAIGDKLSPQNSSVTADDLQGELLDVEESVLRSGELYANADDGVVGDIPVYIIDDVTGAYPAHGTVTLPGYYYYGVGADIPYQVSKGDKVTVEAVPEEDYSATVSVGYIPVVGYTERSLNYDEETNTFTVPSRCYSITLHVTFAKEQEEYSVKTMVASDDQTGNTISVDKDTAEPGETVTVTLNMNPGTAMDSSGLRLYNNDTNDLVDPQPAKVNDTTYTFSMPDCDVYLFAEFILLDYNVSVADTGSITESGFEVSVDKRTAHYGDTVTMTVHKVTSSSMMTVTPLAYYEADGEQISLPLTDAGDGNYTFTMPAYDVTVTAAAYFDGYTISIANLDKEGNPLDAFRPQIYLSAKTYLGTYREIAGETVTVNVESNYTESSTWGTVNVYYTWEENGETKSGTISDLSFDEWLNASGSFVMPAGNVTIYTVLDNAYYVNVESNGYGQIESSVKKAVPGTEVTITATVTNNRYSNLIWTIESEDLAVTVPEGLPNTRTFIMPSETVYFKVDFTMEPVSYVERTWNGNRVAEEEKELLFYNKLTSANSGSITINDENWDGWYVVQGTVDLERLTTQGEVHMILSDGAMLKSNKTVLVSSGSTCTIYGQAADSGMLYAHPGDGPGISGDGALIIQGGAIDAKGASERAGIGGGIGSNQNLSLTINGGTVTAAGGNKGAGIGGGCYDDGKGGRGGEVIIHGGIVNATGGSNGAGIGGAYQGVAGTVTITGGTVTAKGGYLAAGIGGGYLYTKHQSNGNSQSITISGGVVYADVSGNEAAAIGGGCGSNSGTILITGGYIEAKAGSSASVIGAGNGGDCNVIRIESGTIVATSVEFGNAIGRYYGGDAAGTVTIYDNARVTAGKSASTAEVAAANNRVNACRNSIYVKIEPCAHDLVYTYTITDTTHTKVCAHCLTSLPAHAHDIDDLGVCTVCGYQGETNYVTFDANGGSGTMERICYVPGRQVILPVCSFTAPEGMDFGGWQVGEDLDLKAENEIILPSGDVTIKAVWKYLITIRETENGRIIAEPEIASAGDTVTLTALPSDGYVLDELTVTEQHGGSFKTTQNEDGSCSFTMPDCEVFVDASFRETERYTVTFDSNGGSEVEAQTVHAGTKARKPEDPTKEGFTFNGWYLVTATDPETLAETAFDFENTSITADITLKAKWEKQYAVTIADGVANGSVIADTPRADEGDTVTLTVLPEDGYMLKTLTVMQGETEITVTAGETGTYTFTMPAGDVTVSAVFVLADGYYLIGPDWTVDAINPLNKFAVNPVNSNEYMLETALTAGDEIKVVKVENGAIAATNGLYPDGMGNQYTVDADHAGSVTVYFRTTYQNDWSAFGGYIYIEKKAAEIITHSISVNDEIGVNFYLAIPAGTDASGLTVGFAWGEGTAAKTATGTLKANSSVDGANYKVSCPVAARYMNDKVTITLKQGDTVLLTESYSAVDYCLEAAKHYADNGLLLTALCDMLDYGGNVQRHFGYRTDALASDSIADVVTLAKANGNPDFTWTRKVLPDLDSLTDPSTIYSSDLSADYGISFYSASLVATSKTAIRLYFTVTDAEKFANTTVTVGGTKLDFVPKDGKYYVQISGIVARNIFATYEITFANGSNTHAESYSAINYLKAVENSSDTSFDVLKVIMNAMYNYAESTAAYFASLHL